MRKILVVITITFFSLISSFAQKDFKWEKVDSIQKTKEQIYSDTKMFIAKEWKSAQNVIQNDDKEGGQILVRGNSTQKVDHGLNVYTYVYNYSVTFKMKDNKYKIIIDNVYCENAVPVGAARYSILKIEPFDGLYVKGKTGMMEQTLPEKKAVKMMEDLKNELQTIVNDYEKQIKIKSSTNGSDW
jgi:hypothetical protein